MNENQPQFRFVEDALLFVWETVKVVVISLAIIIPIRYYLIQPFFVKGQSMEPNFHDKDYILVDKIGYRFNTPQRGDVIVFKFPEDPTEYFIKRIVGLPGESVEIKDSQVIVRSSEHPDGVVLQENVYLPDDAQTRGELLMKLGPDQYFVLGDNRLHSSDSRSWGPLGKDLISGKAWVRLWPPGRVFQIPQVDY